MKKMMIVSAAYLLFGFAPHVFAQAFVPLSPIPGLTDAGSSVANSASLANFFNNLYKYLIGLAAVLAIIQIVWAGLEIAMNKENVSKITDSKGKIYNAIYGLILVLSPVLVFSIINPSILNLSLNLPPLDTKASIPVQTGTLPICSANQTTDCTQPVCDSYRTTNCIPRSQSVNAVAEGLYPSAQTGGWCYGITPSGGNNFMCVSSQSVCENLFKQDPATVSSCQKY